MNDFVLAALVWGLPAIMINQILFYFIYKLFGNHECIVDVAYSLAHLVAGIVYAIFGYAVWEVINFDNMIIKLILVALWALRLAGFLCYTRVLQGFKDPRYDNIFSAYDSNKFKKDLMVFGQFCFQGLIVFVTSIPLYFLFQNSLDWNNDWLTVVNYIFLCIIPFSIFGEALSDYQLEKFKSKKKQGIYPADQLMEEGLWRKSRHPNLFFDLTTWFCFAMAALYDWVSLCALIGPIILYVVMDCITTPITEKHMRMKRGELFESYCERTNKYFPL